MSDNEEYSDNESINDEISQAVAPYQNRFLTTPRRSDKSNYELVEYGKRAPRPKDYQYRGEFKRSNIEDLNWKKPTHKKGEHVIDMGIQSLKDIVGSKLGRDIKRHTHFMCPETFKLWNKTYGKRKNGTDKYWYDDTKDVDGDYIPEFIVGRNDSKGKKLEDDIIAVNGWTTVKSDYPIRSKYLSKYPLLKQRTGKDGKHFKDFVDEYYLTEENMSPNGWFPKDEYVRDRAIKMYDQYKYNLHMPNPTAFQVFMREVMWVAHKICTTEIADKLELKLKDINDKYPIGNVVKEGKKFFDKWILKPYIEALKQEEAYETYKNKYITNLRRVKKSAEFKEDNFHKWLLKQTSVRDGLNNVVAAIVDNEGKEYNDAIDYLLIYFKGKIDKALGKNSPPMGKYQRRQ